MLASDIPAHREVGGDAAAYAADNDVAAWQTAITQMMGDEDQRQSLVAAGRIRESKFTWIDAARQTEAVYREVV